MKIADQQRCRWTYLENDNRTRLRPGRIYVLGQTQAITWTNVAVTEEKWGSVLTFCVFSDTLVPGSFKKKWHSLVESQQLGAAANFDDLAKFGDCRQIRRSRLFIKIAVEFGCDVIFYVSSNHTVAR